MATATEPNQVPDDPWVSIYLDEDEAESSPVLIRKLPKSELVEHSGFFKAMFRHDFAENRSNKVILHDDDQTAVKMLLHAISEGSVVQATPTTEIIQKHRACAQLLPLLHKYDCPGLEADALRCIFPCVAALMSTRWDANDFFVEHYDPLAEMYGGVYPKERFENALGL